MKAVFFVQFFGCGNSCLFVASFRHIVVKMDLEIEIDRWIAYNSLINDTVIEKQRQIRKKEREGKKMQAKVIEKFKEIFGAQGDIREIGRAHV